MTDRYDKIRKAIAMGPTPGPWAACRTNSGMFVKSERLAGYFVEVRHCRTAQDVNADANLIAACDPDTIRELLTERDELAAEVERLAEALRELERVQETGAEGASMTKINDGGPAFPLPVDDLQCRSRFESGYGGMSLCDYFAAKAMQGYFASPVAPHRVDADDVAKYCYAMADAMLKVRGEQQ